MILCPNIKKDNCFKPGSFETIVLIEVPSTTVNAHFLDEKTSPKIQFSQNLKGFRIFCENLV